LEKGFVDYFKTDKPETLRNLVTPSKAKEEEQEPLEKTNSFKTRKLWKSFHFKK
jgi:hypothetical protein